MGGNSKDPLRSNTQSPSVPHHTDARAHNDGESPQSPQYDPMRSTAGAPEGEAPPATLWQSLSNPSSNPLLSTGLSLLIFGSLLSFGRKGIVQGATLIQRRMLVSLEIPSRDRSHAWLLAWMEEQARRSQHQQQQLGLGGHGSSVGSSNSSKSSRWRDFVDLIGLSNRGPNAPVRIVSRDLAVITSSATSATSAAQQEAQAYSHGGPLPGQGPANKPSKAQFSLVPGPGTHYFRYANTWIRLSRERHGKLIDVGTGNPWETLTLTTLYSSRGVFSKLLGEAEGLASAKVEGKTTVYTAWGLEWRAFGNPRKARQLDSVVLTEGQRERLVADISAFLSRGGWYGRRGIPYRRGYLLHGSPGSGKTSMVQALAGQLDLNICLLNLSERGLTDDKLNHLLSMAPERSVLLLEDIDAAFPSRTPSSVDNEGGADQGGSSSSAATSRTPSQREYQTSVTFSGLLNALDGVASGESRIVVMTTNHVDRLDPALIRPGRVDLIEELGDADQGMVRDLFERFYGESAQRRAATPETDEQEGPADESGREGDPFASPALDGSTFQSLQDRLSVAVTRVSELRRGELGLDPSGRYAAARVGTGSNTPSQHHQQQQQQHQSAQRHQEADGEQRTARKATKATPLPAARGGVSMAELQGLFIRWPLDPSGAVREMEAEVEVATSGSQSSSGGV
ncbi:unnamed protein product [Jaminaea pallidilutea]